MEDNKNEMMNNENELENIEVESVQQETCETLGEDGQELQEETKEISKRKKTITIVVICSILLLLILAAGALFFLKDDVFGQTSSDTDSTYETIIIEEETEVQDDTSSTNSSNRNNSNKTENQVSSESEESQETVVENENLSGKPSVTIAGEVAKGICIVGGSCPSGTEYITVRGDGVTETKIVPYKGANCDYFIGQVKFTKSCYVEVTAKEKGKAESKADRMYADYTNIKQNHMTSGEYYPVIGLNSRSHFYSALLSYSLTTDKLTSSMREKAKTNISNLVSKANGVGAETIFLIIPSSAEIYPETVPQGYSKASGETLYQAFEKIATAAGAKVIYPKDRMVGHRNDGEGYQIYQNTDSHWSAYGAYWGTYDMLEYVAQKYPAAKPRTVSEMQFYTLEMNAGDVVFNLPKEKGFDTDVNSGVTHRTGMKELTNMYRLNIKTLDTIYHGNTGLYLTWHNASQAILHNSQPSGLPNAVIMRDSFGKVAYDMLSDRFATTCWGEFDNYNFPENWESTNPNYVIHLYSERNLLKLMLNDSSASILNLE